MRRREFVKLGAIASAVTAVNLGSGHGRAAAGTELTELSASAAVAAMRRGDMSAESYATALLAQCEAARSLNAFISFHPDQVLEAARANDRLRRTGRPMGRLHGLPLPVKDSVNTRALPTSAGTAALRDFRPADDAPVLQALFSQGAILLGKTNLHELSLGFTTNNSTFGACHNPYDTARSPGGSSGGSAAAVAARLAPLAVAEDTLGSIRVPSAMCGLAGLRPSTGRYPTSAIMPITPRFDSVGAVARTVEDLILFDSVLRPAEPALTPRILRGLRLAVPEYQWSMLHPEVERVAGLALARLRDAGVTLVPVKLPEALKSALDTATGILSFEVIQNETKFLADYHAGISFAELESLMSLGLRKRFESNFTAGGSTAVSPEEYERKVTHLEVLRGALQHFYQDHRLTAMVFPPTLTPPLKIGEDNETIIRDETVPVRTAMARNLALATCAGTPALVLPAGITSDGLPVGIEFDMRRGHDRQLLALGMSLEQVLGPIPPPPMKAEERLLRR
jgi:indoleacetamide hydrolase